MIFVKTYSENMVFKTTKAKCWWFYCFVAENINSKEVTMYWKREMKNEEQLLARQILHKIRTVTEAETFTFKLFGSRSHSCPNERLNLPLLIKGAPN